MNVVKAVIKAVWPIVIKVLQRAAENTETEIDDLVVKLVDGAINAWLDDEDEDVKFLS